MSGYNVDCEKPRIKSLKVSLSESGCFHAERKKIKPRFHESTQVRQKDVQQQNELFLYTTKQKCKFSKSWIVNLL